ncbi:MAG: TetR/AcrR family transcriptional regulator [Paracoccus sp. (in: a-proteobacteria)]|nr:TetR/AcrR family transcriptional regulator [Paracoccus sp. (in: a-proteobacteria)]
MSDEKPQDTRQRILETGIDLLRRKGFSATGLQEILKASGVPKGSFYHYFSSKDAFGCALIGHYIATYDERLDLLLAESGDARTRMMRYWRAWFDDSENGPLYERCLVVKLAAEVADLSDDMRGLLAKGVDGIIDRLTALIEEGRTDGSIPAGAPADALARTLYQMWLGAALIAKLNRSPTSLEQAMGATRALLA